MQINTPFSGFATDGSTIFRLSVLLVAGLALPGVGHGEDAEGIMQAMQDKQIARAEGVDGYSVTREMMGQAITEYYKRIEVEVDDDSIPMFVRAQPEEFRCAGAEAQMTPEGLEAYGDGLEMMGDGVANEIEKGLEAAGLPRGLFSVLGQGGDPWATTDMRRFTGGMATFARGAADAQRNRAAESLAEVAAAPEMQAQVERFAAEANLVGTEEMDGRKAYLLRADGLNQVHEENGQKMVTEAMNLWVDSSRYVPLKMKLEGTMTSGQETRPFTMEKMDLDYREVPDSEMYESYRQVIKMGGMMDKAQEAEMQKAQQELAKLDQQLAAMPADQRQMMEKMMGGQLDMIRKMAASGGFEMETVIREIKVLKLLDPADCKAAIRTEKSGD